MRVTVGVLCNNMAKKGSSINSGRCSARNLTINIIKDKLLKNKQHQGQQIIQKCGPCDSIDCAFL